MMLQLKGKRVLLRRPLEADFEEFARQAEASVGFHKGLVAPPREQNSFGEYIEKGQSKTNEHFLICDRGDKTILGAINLSQIFYGSFECAYLGYYLFKDYSGKGFMSEALNLVLEFAFDELGLHRLEANIQPWNKNSIRLVERTGFKKEGFSEKYLRIEGKWRDHERWAIIREDFAKTND